jgi:NADH/F420H2 dehydrogenase subunit C
VTDEHAVEETAASAGDAVPGFEPPADPILAGLAERVPGARFGERQGQAVAEVDRGDLVEFATAAKEAGFEMCVDVTAVDYLRRNPRFEVVVSLVSMQHHRRLRVLVGVPGDDPVAPSLVGVYPSTNFYEREVYDLMGVSFDGHPDLTRIVLPDDWVGHPLRKDEPVGSVPVLFKSADEER